MDSSAAAVSAAQRRVPCLRPAAASPALARGARRQPPTQSNPPRSERFDRAARKAAKGFARLKSALMTCCVCPAVADDGYGDRAPPAAFAASSRGCAHQRAAPIRSAFCAAFARAAADAFERGAATLVAACGAGFCACACVGAPAVVSGRRAAVWALFRHESGVVLVSGLAVRTRHGGVRFVIKIAKQAALCDGTGGTGTGTAIATALLQPAAGLAIADDGVTPAQARSEARPASPPFHLINPPFLFEAPAIEEAAGAPPAIPSAPIPLLPSEAPPEPSEAGADAAIDAILADLLW